MPGKIRTLQFLLPSRMSSVLLILSDPTLADRIWRAVAADDATSIVVAGSVATLAEGREFMKRRLPDLIVIDLRVADGPVARWLDQFSGNGRARFINRRGAARQDDSFRLVCL